MKRVNLLAASVLAFAQTLSGAAVAAPVTLTGSTVDFSFDDSLLGLFGPASIAGDTLYFTPTSFVAESMNGEGFDLARETLNVQMTARSGYELQTLNVVERGDYLLYGSGSFADVGGQVRVFNVAAPLDEITASIAPQASMTMTGLPTHNWNSDLSVNLAGFAPGTLNVTLQNLVLASTSAPGSLAFAEKKFAGLTAATVAVTPVPEADTYAMMLAGLGLVGWGARRRRKAA